MDFHIHISLDGNESAGMTVAEALHYAALAGCRTAGLVLRSDGGNLACVSMLARQVRRMSLFADVEAFTGVELVHIPPPLLPDAVREAREAGADFVMVHGETLAEQVSEGTNFSAVEAGADIVAHPGLVDIQMATFAAERGVALEWSACPRHALANAHVASMAERTGLCLLPGSDARRPHDLLPQQRWKQLFQGGALSDQLRESMRNNAILFVKKMMAKYTCQKK